MLTELSNQMADLVSTASRSVVQVQGHRRPASGLAWADDVVVTTMRLLGREDGLHVRTESAEAEAQLLGWDPATGIAVLRAPGLALQPLTAARTDARVGHLAMAIARSWSNHITASAGVVSVIGGPMPTSRRRAIEQVIRTTAPMHSGFAGGAFLDMTGGLIGLTTAMEIRGLGVVVPTAIVQQAVTGVLKHGGIKRGYLGIAGQPVVLPENQRDAEGREEALLVAGVSAGSPAARAGILVGDIVIAFDGQPVESPEDLLDLLAGDRVGRSISLRIIRGGQAQDVAVTVGERPSA